MIQLALLNRDFTHGGIGISWGGGGFCKSRIRFVKTTGQQTISLVTHDCMKKYLQCWYGGWEASLLQEPLT